MGRLEGSSRLDDAAAGFIGSCACNVAFVRGPEGFLCCRPLLPSSSSIPFEKREDHLLAVLVLPGVRSGLAAFEEESEPFSYRLAHTIMMNATAPAAAAAAPCCRMCQFADPEVRLSCGCSLHAVSGDCILLFMARCVEAARMYGSELQSREE